MANPTKRGIYRARWKGLGGWWYNYFDGEVWYNGWATLAAFKMPSKFSDAEKGNPAEWSGADFDDNPFTLQMCEQAAAEEQLVGLKKHELEIRQGQLDNARDQTRIQAAALGLQLRNDPFYRKFGF